MKQLNDKKKGFHNSLRLLCLFYAPYSLVFFLRPIKSPIVLMVDSYSSRFILLYRDDDV